jgi:hypothetical protein
VFLCHLSGWAGGGEEEGGGERVKEYLAHNSAAKCG